MNGKTFRAANAHASLFESRDPPAAIKPTREDGSPRLRALAAGGAGGYAPDHYRARFFRSGSRADARNTADDPSSAPAPSSSPARSLSPLACGASRMDHPGSERGLKIPGDIGHVPRKIRVPQAQSGVSVALNGEVSLRRSFGSRAPQRVLLPRAAAETAAENGKAPSDTGQGPRASPQGSPRSSPQRSPGRNRELIPGYSGHVPKKGPENIFGTTYRQSNERAALVQDVTNGDVPPAAPAASEARDYPRGREHSGEIPSHIDHVPRKGPSVSGADAQRNLTYPKGRSVIGEIPSHIDHVPRKVRSLRNQQNFPGDHETPPAVGDGRRPERSLSPRHTIPGYAGYVPKVGPRNVFGLRYKAANEEANMTGEANGTVGESARSNGSTISRSMSETRFGVPGYTGYIPKKGPGNILGATHRAGVERALRGSDPVKEALTETSRLQEGASVWEAWSFAPPDGRKASEDVPDTPQLQAKASQKSSSRLPAGIIVGGECHESPESAMLQSLAADLDGPPPLSLPRSSPRPAWK